MPSMPPLSSFRWAHFIGIGGAGMSGLARLLQQRGLTVTGSDSIPTAITEQLVEECDIAVDLIQDGTALHTGIDLVIASAAIKSDNAELSLARRRRIPVLKYAEVLGLLMQERVGIGIAGTHGKTSTSSLFAHLFQLGGKQPSWLIGGVPHDLATNAKYDKRGAYMIAEACEYDRSFHHLNPRIAVVTNIDADHLDYYGSLEAIRESFARYVSLVPPWGLVVAHGDDPETRACIRSAAVAPVVFYGESDANDWVIERCDEQHGLPRAILHRADGTKLPIATRVPGWQNVWNATAAAIVAQHVGIDDAVTQSGISSFRGVARRFDVRGHVGNVPVIDDYAHHPAEIDMTLAAARSRYPGRELWVVFQPHQAYRTRTFFGEFAWSLAQADRVLLLDIYAAREGAGETENRTLPLALADAVRANGTTASHHESMTAVIDEIRWTLPDHALLLTVGAGDVDAVADALTRNREAAA